MNTIITKEARIEKARALCGLSNKYRTHKILNSGVGQVYVDSTNHKLVKKVSGDFTIDNFSVGDVIFLNYDSKEYGRVIKNIISDVVLGNYIEVDYEFEGIIPTLSSPCNFSKGLFLYQYRISTIAIGDGGYDELNNRVKIVTGDETSLFNELIRLNPEDEDEPLNDLIGKKISEVGIYVEYWNDELNEYEDMMLGIVTFGQKIKDINDVIELSLFVNN